MIQWNWEETFYTCTNDKAALATKIHQIKAPIWEIHIERIGGLLMVKPKEKQPDAKIQWHPAFCAAAELELRLNKADLEFKREYKMCIRDRYSAAESDWIGQCSISCEFVWEQLCIWTNYTKICKIFKFCSHAVFNWFGRWFEHNDSLRWLSLIHI